MRSVGRVLVVVAAFGAGVVVGQLDRAPRAERRRSRPPEAASAESRAPAPADRGVPDIDVAPAPTTPRSTLDPRGPPDRDQLLTPGTEFAEWSGFEFARWYAIHRVAWDLPELDHESLVEHGRFVVALGRIPRREVLVRLLKSLEAWDAAVERLAAESAAWHEANPRAGRDHPEKEAFRERSRAIRQRAFDDLHEEFAYPDYLLLFTTCETLGIANDVQVRPPAAGDDPYGHSVAFARGYEAFVRWYGVYRAVLGFRECDEDLLEGFHRHVVKPLGRLPAPALMRALMDAHVPQYPRLTSGEDWEAAVGDFFARLDAALAPLDYERIRHSHEWNRYRESLPIPPPTRR